MSPCRGRAAEYEYANVPGGQYRTKVDAAESLCSQSGEWCSMRAQCAAMALKHHALGMVWAGVPIPPDHDNPNTARARLRLIEVALYGSEQHLDQAEYTADLGRWEWSQGKRTWVRHG